jgi:hypothetical protein
VRRALFVRAVSIICEGMAILGYRYIKLESGKEILALGVSQARLTSLLLRFYLNEDEPVYGYCV